MIGLTVLAHDFLGKTTHVLDVNPASSVRINPAQNTQRCPSQARKSGQSHPQIGEILRPSITRIWQTKSFVLAAATSNLRSIFQHKLPTECWICYFLIETIVSENGSWAPIWPFGDD